MHTPAYRRPKYNVRVRSHRRESNVEREKLLERISVDPGICFGKPCIRGHRIRVSFILDLLSLGLSVERILEEYPQLTREDVLACVAYGAEMSRERFVDVHLEAQPIKSNR